MKIAICTPVHQHPTWQYTSSLANLLTAERARDIIYVSVRGSHIATSRNILAEDAFKRGAKFILWIDSDHSFPPDTLSRLLAHGLDFVGCNYARRDDPTGPTAMRDGKSVWTTHEMAAAGLVEPADALGMGACLTSRRVFEAFEGPWFTDGNEDFTFCAKAVAAGIRPHVDHGLSWQIGHVRESLVTNLHALMDRGRWELMQGK